MKSHNILLISLLFLFFRVNAQQAYTIDQTGSNLCEGLLYDSGGPNADYGANEDLNFVICPQTPSGCITFELEFYDIEDGANPLSGDFLSFYDGPDINSPRVGPALGGSLYGGGGVCYTVKAKSGCLTVLFQSNGSKQASGFKGKWTCSPLPCPSPTLMTVQANPKADSVLAAVQTPFTQVKLVSMKCPSNAMGIFKTPALDNSLGLRKGLLLSTGNAASATGPNTKENTGTDNSAPGDADLDQISLKLGQNQVSKDACVVEFDVFASSEELRFEYIFASEEYPEWVNTSYNDIFAFLISGPGIAGDPMLGGALNIATLPNTNQIIQVNSVSPNTNWPYYRPNPVGAQSLEYDGFTSDSMGRKKTLTARAKVIPCNTYRLKLALADRTDGKYDSAVFIADINGGTPSIVTDFEGGVNFLREGCTADAQKIVFTQPEGQNKENKFFVKIGGSATRNSDYSSNLPDSVVFKIGETTKTYTISQIKDNVVEGTETIVVYLSNNANCGTIILDSLVIQLRDLVEVNIATKDSAKICKGIPYPLQASGASTYAWSPAADLNNPTLPAPILFPKQTGWYKVVGSTDGCSDADSVFIMVGEPLVDVSVTDKNPICLGESTALKADFSPPFAQLTWMPSTGLSNVNSPTPTASPSTTTTYRATVALDNCSASDSVKITVNPTVVLEAIKAKPASGSLLCEGMEILLATRSDPPGAPITWFQNGTKIQGQTLDSLKIKALGDSIKLVFSVKTDNNFGCAVNPDSVSYFVKRCFLMPNAFTPNGDGVNDSFGLVDFGGPFSVESFQVYDRWGQLAFDALPNEKRWDGTSNGLPSPPDVYTYKIIVRYPDRSERMVTGAVTLLR